MQALQAVLGYIEYCLIAQEGDIAAGAGLTLSATSSFTLAQFKPQ